MPNTERIKDITEHKYDLNQLAEHYHKNLNREALYYLENRGIGQETIDKFQLGFESGKIGFYIREHSLAEYFEDRIIVPITKADGSIVDLVGRAFDQREPMYKSLYGVDDLLYNEQALADSEEVIVCSDILEVLTLMQVDLPAVCMPNTLLFKETFAGKFDDKRVFICLSNDETGRRESARIETLLKEHAKETFIIQLPEKIRSINELFVKREKPLDSFRDILSHTIEDTLKAPISPDLKYLTVFNEEYVKRHGAPAAKAPSGIKGLDKLLSGGFASGLYMLAGPPNMGKSTLMKQMADHIALQRQPVVYVTWDMTPFELWARSVARFLGTAPQQVLDAELPPADIDSANQSFTEMSKMQWTYECNLQTVPQDICHFVEKIAVQAGKPPVVFIDHFHRLVFALRNEKEESEADAEEHIIYTLKQWTRDWNTPVITAVSVDSSNVSLINGIQATADSIITIVTEPSERGPRLQRLKLIKNRNGALGEVAVRFTEDKAVFSEIRQRSGAMK